MNDDFLHQHRQDPPESFGKTLLQQLSNDEVIIPPRTVPWAQPARLVRLVATILIVIAAGFVTLQSLNRPTGAQLTQIDMGVLLADLPPITADNVDRLETIAEIGSGRVAGIAYSPDGATLAVGTPDGIALYDGGLDATPRLLRSTQPINYTRPLAFSPDGAQIALFEPDAVYLWDVASGTQTTRLAMDETTPYYGAVTFSPDGRYLAASGSGYSPARFNLYVWDVQTGEQVGATSSSGATLGAIAFSPQSDWLAALTGSGAYRYSLDLQTAIQLDAIRDPRGNGLAFTPDGATLAIGRSNDVALVDVATQTISKTIPVSQSKGADAYGYVLNLAFNHDGTLLAISTQNYGISVWDMTSETFTVPPEQTPVTQNVSDLVFQPNSDQFAAVRYGTTIEIVDGRSGEIVAQTAAWDGSSNDFSISADGQTIATYGEDGIIRMYDAQTGKLSRTFDTGIKYLYAIEFSPSGRYLAYSGWDIASEGTAQGITSGGIKVIDMEQENPVPIQLGDENYGLNAYQFVSDQRIVTYDPTTYHAVYWDIDAPEQKHTLTADYIPNASGINISTDGHMLVTSASATQHLQLYDVNSGAKIELDILANQGIDAAGFSPDGTLLALSYHDSQNANAEVVSVWNMTTQTEVFRREFASTLSVNAFAFSPDGSLLTAVDFDKLTVLDAETGETRYESTAVNSASYEIAFADDGKYLVTSGQDGIMRLWGVIPGN